MQAFMVRGLPRGLAKDAWWMSDVSQSEAGSGGGASQVKPRAPWDRTLWSLAVLIALLILADWLFWERYIGISLAGFALVLHGCLWALSRDEATRRSTAFHAATALLSVLPSVELVQSLSVLFLIAGLLVNAARVALGHEGLEAGILRAVMRLPMTPFFALLRDVKVSRLELPLGTGFGNLVSRWALPVIGSVIFLGLFAIANPVLDRWIGQVFSFEFALPEGLRIAFWVVLAAVLWPLLVPRRQYEFLKAGRQVNLTGPIPGANGASIANALVVFNLLMFGQNILDGATLIGMIPLPETLTLSQYVRQGAYTLIATAMLAGGFAILARPFVRGSARLSGLLYIWLVQNAVLVLSGGYRLALVIEENGLSLMRIYGGIWMLVVLGGLGLIGWQVARVRSNGWLWQRNFAAVTGVLYLCCFVNFGHIVAVDQVKRDNINGYICTLGVHAAGAMSSGPFQRWHPCGADWENGPEFHSWLDWGFRDARVRAYLARNVDEGSHERANPDY